MIPFAFFLLAVLSFPMLYDRWLGLEPRPAGPERSLRWIQFFVLVGLGWAGTSWSIGGGWGSLVGVVLVLGYAELFARLTVRYLLGHVGARIPICHKIRRYLTDDPEDIYFTLFVPHPFLQFTGHRTAVADRQGEFPYGFKNIRLSDVPKPLGVIRIACLGGSTTEDGYPEMLQEFLKEKCPGKKIQVLNFGRTWWSSVHTLVNYILNVVEFKPDFVVVHDNCNDHQYRGFAGLRGDCAHAYRVFVGPGGSDQWLYRFSVVYRFLKILLMRIFPKRFRPDIGLDQIGLRKGKTFHYDPKELQIFRRNLNTLCTVAGSQGTMVCLLTMPYSNVKKYSEAHDRIYRPHLKQANEIIRQVAQEKKTLLMDLDAAMTSKEEYYEDPVHVTPEGNRAKARAVGECLLPHIR